MLYYIITILHQKLLLVNENIKNKENTNLKKEIPFDNGLGTY